MVLVMDVSSLVSGHLFLVMPYCAAFVQYHSLTLRHLLLNLHVKDFKMGSSNLHLIFIRSSHSCSRIRPSSRQYP
jgi:hypothetical protein